MTAQRLDDLTSVPLWDRPTPAGPDRVTPLDTEHVARTAMALADAEQLGAVSVKRVAHRLRVPAARLEHWLPDRDDLFDLVLDTALGDVELPDPGLDHRTRLELLASRTREVATAHSWFVELAGGRAPSGPRGLRYVEAALAACALPGRGVRDAALAFHTLMAFVHGSVRLGTRWRSGRSRSTGASDQADYLLAAVTDGHHPMLTALFTDAGDLTADETFTVGLARLLDGLGVPAGAGDPDGRPGT